MRAPNLSSCDKRVCARLPRRINLLVGLGAGGRCWHPTDPVPARPLPSAHRPCTPSPPRSRRDRHWRKGDVHLLAWSENRTAARWPLLCNIMWVPLCWHELREHETLRLFSDSCYGQSKNINVLLMLFAPRKQKFKDPRIN